MEIFFKTHIRKIMYGVLFFGLIFSVWAMGNKSVLAAPAETSKTTTPQPTRMSASNKYFTARTFTLPDGTTLEDDTISGPPTPPPGNGLDRPVASLLVTDSATGQNILTDVPAYNWFFGCSATSGAMIAGYYDRNGYPQIYTGPANGGVMPPDNSIWPTWTDGNGDTYRQNPLDASHNGLDGRTTRGSIDDYWVAYGSSALDPFITHGWTEHTWGDAIGDYMKTSESNYSNDDGSTNFFNYSTAVKLTCSQMETLSDPYGSGKHISALDGTYGRKLFYQARGYTVTDCYNQETDNQVSGGFSYAQFKAEIDAGRPVMLNFEGSDSSGNPVGHTMVGVGYNDPNTIYLHDTWDFATHTMTWNGAYSDYNLRATDVSIVNIAGGAPATFTKSLPANLATGVSTTPTLSWAASAGATSYEYCFDTTNDNACSSWNSTGTNTSAPLIGLSAGITYYWQVRANNAGGTTYANTGTYWSYTTQNSQPCYTLTTSANPSGSGTVTPDLAPNCATDATKYTSGTVVTLTAHPASGYTFANWSGDAGGTTNPVTVSMTAARSVTANFVLPGATTTLTVGNGVGSPVTIPYTLALPSSVSASAITFEVLYDPAVFNVPTCTADPDNHFDSKVVNNSYDTDGVNPDKARISLISTAGVTGTNVKLADCSFTTKSSPVSSTLNANIITLARPDGSTITPATVVPGTWTPGTRGDVNCDNTRDVVDAMYTLQYTVGLRQAAHGCSLPTTAPSFNIDLCDVNNDSQCDATDALFTLQCTVGIHNVSCPAGSSEAAPVLQAYGPIAPSSTFNIGMDMGMPGNLVTIPISVNAPPANRLGAATLELHYDPTLVRPVACEPAAGSPFSMTLCNMGDDQGVLWLSVVAPEGASGISEMVNVTFDLIGPAGSTAPLSMGVVSCVDPLGVRMNGSIQDGEINIVPSVSKIFIPAILSHQ